MKIKPTLLALLLGALLSASASTALAQSPPTTTVSVVDETSVHPHQRYSQAFTTQLLASITNPPVSQGEYTVTGPTWSWTVVLGLNSGKFGVTANENPATATFTSVSLPLPSASFTIQVEATATYSEYDSATGDTISLAYSGTGEVTGFGIAPTGFTQNLYQNQEVTDGPTAYGHVSQYILTCQDNDDGKYIWGNAVETLVNPTYTATYEPYIVAHQPFPSGNYEPLDGSTSGTPGNILDTDSMFDWNWGPPYGGTDTGAYTFWAGIVQQMTVEDVVTSPMLTAFSLDHDQSICLRQ